jgi:hypothetical protein
LPLCIPWRHTGGTEVQLHSFLTSALDGGEWPTSCSICIKPQENNLGICWIWGYVSLTTITDVLEEKTASCTCKDLNPDPSSL